MKQYIQQKMKKYFNTPVRLASMFLIVSILVFNTVLSFAQKITPDSLSTLPGTLFYFPETGMKLTGYILGVPIFFIYFAYFFWLLNNPSRNISKQYIQMVRKNKPLALWFIIVLILIGLSCIVHTSFLHILFAFTALFFPLIQFKPNRYIDYLISLSCIAACILLFGFCSFFIIKPLQIENGYYNIPTYLKQANTFISDKELFQTQTPLLSLGKKNQFCMPVQNEQLFSQTSNKRDFFIKGNELCFLWLPDSTTVNNLKIFLTPAEQETLLQLLQQLAIEKNNPLAPSLIAILDKLDFQIRWQVYSRGFIHHHNHLFGAAHAYIKGKPLKDIFMQYGVGTTIGLALILQALGRVDYPTYIRVYYLAYPLYYLFFFWLGSVILRDKKYSTIQIFLSTAFFLLTSYLFFKLAPGFSPYRHFFDIFIVWTIFMYCKTTHKRWLLGAIGFSWLAILTNLHFGLMLFVSLWGMLFVKVVANWKNKNKFEIFSLALAALGGLLITYISRVGSISYEGYFLAGLLGFPFTNLLLFIIFLLVMGCYLLITYAWHKKSVYNYPLLFLVFYSQGVCLYYLRSAVPHHIYHTAPIFIFTLLVAFKLFEEIRKKNWETFKTILCLISAVFFWAQIQPFYHSYRNEMKKFRNKQIFFWNFPNTHFETLMPIEPFAQAANLIQKYNSDNGVYIISQYDNILPLISDKYTNMPFIDLQWFLTTQKEFDLVLNTLHREKPLYLFVDTDILRNPAEDIIHPSTPEIGYLYEESLWRAQRLNLLGDIFRAVQNDYELVERGDLISVYKRKVPQTELP